MEKTPAARMTIRNESAGEKLVKGGGRVYRKSVRDNIMRTSNGGNKLKMGKQIERRSRKEQGKDPLARGPV